MSLKVAGYCQQGQQWPSEYDQQKYAHRTKLHFHLDLDDEEAYSSD